MKIAFFTDTYLPQLNGVAIYLNDAIKEISKKNEIILFAPGENTLKIQKKTKNFKIYWIPSSPFPFYDGYRVASMNYKRISDILEKELPDVVHAHAPINLGLQGLLAAKQKKIPTIATYHTHFPDYIPHLLSGKLPEVFDSISKTAVKKMINHVFKRVDVVTAPTTELVKELESYGLKQVTHLPNGIDFKKLRYTKEQLNRFRKKHNIPDNKKILIYLGRVSFEKNIDILLEAYKKIEKEDRILVVAGGGPYLKKFKEMAVSLRIENIIFTGFLDAKEIGTAYACGNIFVSASNSETFGLTFVEAMSLGLPTIGVKRLGPKEIILHGKTGLLVEPDNIDDLANAMEMLLNNGTLRKKMSKAAKIRAKEYSIEKSIGATIDIYKKIENTYSHKK
ncbi:MAG: glycosyltransferase [Candidatus Micrarchaeota archaeon]